MAKYRHRVFEMYDSFDETVRALTPRSTLNEPKSTAPDSTAFKHLAISCSAGVTHVQFKSAQGAGEEATTFRGDLARLSESLDRNSRVLLDFAGVTSLTPACIAALAQFQQRLRTKGSRVALCCLESAARESFSNATN